MTAQTTDIPQKDGLHDRRWIALGVIMVAGFMDLVDVTIVNIAIPAIERDLGPSTSQVQWIVAAYALTFAVGLITGGRLGDIYGRKKVFLVGVAGFTVVSAACGVATTPESLIGFRLAQGLFAAVMVPQILAIIHSTFPAHERGKVFGMWGAIVGLGGISGPLLGALLTEWNLFGLEWRPIFLINVPVGIAVLVLGAKYVSESRAPQALRLDIGGLVLGTTALLMLILPLTRGEETGWPTWGFVAMAGSIVVLAALVAYERAKSARDGSPLLELSLFKVRSFAGGAGVQTAFGVVSGLFFLIWTLYLQVGLGWSVLHAGLTGLPFSIATAAAAGMSVQLLVPRFGRKVLQAGALIMALGMAGYGLVAGRLGSEISTWHMIVPLLVVGIGMGLIVAPLIDATLADVPLEHAGSASGIFNTMLQVGQALGLALTSVLFFRVVADNAAQGPTAFIDGFSHATYWIAGILVGIAALMTTLPATVPNPAAMPEGAVPEGQGARPPADAGDRVGQVTT